MKDSMRVWMRVILKVLMKDYELELELVIYYKRHNFQYKPPILSHDSASPFL